MTKVQDRKGSHEVQLEAGGLLPLATKVDKNSTEEIAARDYRHPALGARPVVRLGADRLGQAEDLAMEFFGFDAPTISKPIAIQHIRSLSFAAWALVNDPDNARYALDVVKRMKAAARKARSKPGHAWDAYAEISKELGRSARHFLPPYWEEVGRVFKDLGNQTYAGRALNKSLEAERVHALESDRARRRDVVLEFVLAGCLSGKALSDYANDLQNQFESEEAFRIFRDLVVRRTRGGMAPWAAMPKDFAKAAKAAGLDADEELEKWLEEIIETPAMGRASNQFWKHCDKHCQRIVARSPAFAVALLQHTRPAETYYGGSQLGPWLDLIEKWGVFPYLWEDEHQGAPPLGESIAEWFGRIVRADEPAEERTLDMLQGLIPRLKKEKKPLCLSKKGRWDNSDTIDVDVLEACLAAGIKVDDPPENVEVTFDGWIMADNDHEFRNLDLVESWRDERFLPALLKAMDSALACRGGKGGRRYSDSERELSPFPVAAAEREGIKGLWYLHASRLLDSLEGSGLQSFSTAQNLLQKTLWPDTLRLFPDLAERLEKIDTTDMLQTTLQAGIFDEYGWPALEQMVEKQKLKVKTDRYGETNISLTFPYIAVTDKVHAHVVCPDGSIIKHELRVAKSNTLDSVMVVGDDLAVKYRDNSWEHFFHWASNPKQKHKSGYNSFDNQGIATVMPDGGVFFGQRVVRSGDTREPEQSAYFHDGERFWQMRNDFSDDGVETRKVREVNPETGKAIRESVPPWFEKTDGGELVAENSELHGVPKVAADSPLGTKGGLVGWKTIKRRDGTYFGEGIDGRRWEKPLIDCNGEPEVPVALLQQPGTDSFWPITVPRGNRSGPYTLWDPLGTTEISRLVDYNAEDAWGQVTLLPIQFWHLLKPRDIASSKKLRSVSKKQCEALLKAAAEDRAGQAAGAARRKRDQVSEETAPKLLAAVKNFLPNAPERLVLGLVRFVQDSDSRAGEFESVRDKAIAQSKKSGKSSAAGSAKVDAAAEHWDMETAERYESEVASSTSAHIAETVAFLKGESEGGNLTATGHIWFSLLDDLAFKCWKTYWSVTETRLSQKSKGARDDSWLEFLRFLNETGITELPGELSVMDAIPEGVKKDRWGSYDFEVEAGSSFTMKNGEDLFVLVEVETYGDMPYTVLRYSTAKKPGTPAGYKVGKARKLKPACSVEEVAAFIESAKAYEGIALPTEEELAETAANMDASPAEVGLIWLAGMNIDAYESNFLPAELRKALGWKVADASAGRQSLQNLKESIRDKLYRAVISGGLAAPFAKDRGPALKAIESTWRANTPKRLALEAKLQKRLSALGKTGWQQVDHQELLSIAADPAKHPTMQPRELEIQLIKERHYSNLGLKGKKKGDHGIDDELPRSIVQLVSMVHAETPAGDKVREQMPALITQTAKLLAGPKFVLPLRHFYLHETGRKKPPKPSEWINKHVGRTKKPGRDGLARADDGLLVAAGYDSELDAFVAFRPAKLKSKGDMSRLLGLLEIDRVENFETTTMGVLGHIAILKSPGFQKLAMAILANDIPAGAWPNNPLHTAPKVVEEIKKKHKLSDDAALAYAQLLALPDPTTANMRTWNDWTAARIKKATAELIKQKLVMEAKRARAGRNVFLPGEWAELKAPWLPIETWKLPHLTESDLDSGQTYPVGGPMVLRPFEDLFAAAWQRVLDGDMPKYEEVKRKRKKSTR